LTVTSYTPGATYVVSIKYDTKSISGSTFAGDPTAIYGFRSKVNGTLVSGSTGSLSAQSTALGCTDDTPNPPNNCTLPTVTRRAPTSEQPGEQLASEPGIRAYPNPFKDVVNFQISSKVAGRVRLEVYNLQGQRLGVVFDGWMMAGEVRNVQYKSRTAASALVYYLYSANKKMIGKIFRLE
jgi:hypothetical protein